MDISEAGVRIPVGEVAVDAEDLMQVPLAMDEQVIETLTA
jgi:hypothetical protein